jgi:hypothetical protein
MSRKVLISPIGIGEPRWSEKILPVALTKQQVKDSPGVDTEKPVSRQYEVDYLGYYGYPSYWGGAGYWGGGYYPSMLMPGYVGIGSPYHRGPEGNEVDYARAAAAEHRDDDPHLRSCKAVTGYHVLATDGEVGHVALMLIDEATWAIRYIVVDTGSWWQGHKVLIAPQWIDEVRWSDNTFTVSLTRQAVKDAPPYLSVAELDRRHETRIYEHYGHPGYWANETRSEAVVSER